VSIPVSAKSTHHTSRLALLHSPHLLVVDPAPSNGRTPCIAARFVASQALARGYRVSVHANVCPGSPLCQVDEARPDIVVLVLHGGIGAVGTGRDRVSWDAYVPVVRSYRDAGARVIAFDAGAMAAVTATFAQQGAHPVFDLDRVFDDPSVLESEATDLPAVFRGLLQLTSHERSVLFQLTEGHSAGEIAPKMSVSLSTVRAHIRSILKKLDVNSQLAAVALAHGTYTRDPEVIAV
jgi:DNA-binding NarL/FixJ family response regulator